MAHPELLSESFDSLLDQMAEFYTITVSKKGRTVEGIREHQELLRHCRETGVDVGFAGKRGRKNRSLESLICCFFFTDSLEEARKIVERYPEVLLESSNDLVDRVVGFSLTAEGTRKTEERRQLLRRCRENGIEIAFAFLR
ncbi:MAG: hypothetical protein NTX17_10650 [Candidatus Eisenbacteria bacterium]|nr:hypothetical protein [Candidatus Eisenbacteria bacterium]